MRAILMATSTEAPLLPSARKFDPMKLLVDRSVVQYVVELLTIQGITRFDLVLDESAAEVEAMLGDGSRWGVAIHYHLMSHDSKPFAGIRAIDGIDSEEILLLTHVDYLVDVGVFPSSIECPRLFVNDGSRPISSTDWTGWAFVQGRDLCSVPPTSTRSSLFSFWADRATLTSPLDWLELGSDREFLLAQKAILEGRFAAVSRVGREVKPGVWLSRNVKFHDTSTLLAPVYIGEDCLIGARVQIGPNVVVGTGSVIDDGTSVVDALILPHTYAGPGLELNGVILNAERVRVVATGTEFTPDDATILGKVGSSPILDTAREWINRLVSLVAFALIAPFAVLGFVLARIHGERLRLTSREVVKTPARADRARWRTHRLWSLVEPTDRDTSRFRDLYGRFWPGLLAVATGKMRLVGQPARSIAELDQMLRESRDWACSARSGLITESMVRLDPDASREERQFVDACQAQEASWHHDLGLFLGYFTRLVGLRRP
jgi:hypothetical protein